MKCRDMLCVYNSDFLCILKKISLDSHAVCERRTVIPMDEEFLKNEKQRLIGEREYDYFTLEDKLDV